MLIWDIALPTLLFNTKPCTPLHFMPSFQSQRQWNCFLPNRHKISGMDTALKNPTTSIFRKPPEDTNSKFL
jgi:hypothetical protein